MQFISGAFLLFLPLFFLLMVMVKPKYRYLVLLAANYIFYGWNNWAAIPVLIASTLWTYLGGYVLEHHKKRQWYGLFFTVNILILVIYKYADFFIFSFNRIFSSLFTNNLLIKFDAFNLVAPIGLSFYIFQSSSYLNDVYRKNMNAEKNILRYASFVSFFPTILSGPIQRSRDILPQLKNPENPTAYQLKSGFLLFLWGVCEKLLVANRLSAVSNSIFSSYTTQDSIHLLLAAVCFSLYIYSDFSSYSDMACGIASMLGYHVHTNFHNPYLAETLGDFWNRWHMSLNTWFIENIYIPLGGSRKGKIRKYFNIITVFLISGLWHGASWHFVIWGFVNGFLRIMGEVLYPVRQKFWQALKVDTECASIRFIRRASVFILITMTWVFFTMPACSASIEVLIKICSLHMTDLANPTLIELAGSARETMSLCAVSFIFIVVQYLRKEEGKFYTAFTAQPILIQHLCIAVSVVVCLVAAMSDPSNINTQFIYFQF